uniref:Uncharacterized protein n=1 Tax=Graphocephala atropunctata TaxID=36148 RepID=A0A1B6LV94_9HEMI
MPHVKLCGSMRQIMCRMSVDALCREFTVYHGLRNRNGPMELELPHCNAPWLQRFRNHLNYKLDSSTWNYHENATEATVVAAEREEGLELKLKRGAELPNNSL